MRCSMPPIGARCGDVSCCDQLLLHADEIAAAAIDPLEDLVAVRLRLLGAFNPRQGRTARVEHCPDRPTGDLQGAGDLADPVALRP